MGLFLQIIPSPHTNVGATAPDLFVEEMSRSAWRTAEGVEDLLMTHTADQQSSIVGVVEVVELTTLAGGRAGSALPRGL